MDLKEQASLIDLVLRVFCLEKILVEKNLVTKEELENNLKKVLKTVPKTVFQKLKDMISKSVLEHDEMTQRLRTSQMEEKEAK